MDTLKESYVNLLDYVRREHGLDHHDGFCDDPPETCLTCEWLKDAEKNLESIK